MSKITFTSEERTLLVLYLEDTKAQTEENISNMQKELTSAEKELFLLAEDVRDARRDGETHRRVRAEGRIGHPRRVRG